MQPQHEDRRLTTILAADVVGYSRLMAADESGTVAQLKAHRKELLDPKTTEHHGRVVKLMGDGTLMEFGSVIDAVKFAVDVQKAMAERNSDVPDERQIIYRIGINIGDVIVEDDDIYGDGVNVAARLEQLADPGGICIARNVFNQVKNKLDVNFRDIGEQKLKNIPEAVRAYQIVMGSKDPGPAAVKRDEPLPLPDKPSIAVLPFVNMSDDPKQEYFSDGITEDLITDLSKISALFVVSRNAVFLYKGKATKPVEVSQELGVRYVLEGSVRKAADRVRITAQLIDPTTGYHLWAERYDRELTDIFALQDEITEKIVKALEVRLTEGEQEQVASRYTDNLEAYDHFLRGRAYQARGSKESNAHAQKVLERAIGLDPTFAGAYARLSYSYHRDWFNQWSEGPQALERAFEAAKKAVALDDSLPLAHTYLAWACVWRKQHEEAIAEGQRAIALDPNFAEGYARLGQILTLAGRPQEGIDLIRKAMRLDPHYPPVYLNYLGRAYFTMGKHEEAITALKGSLTRDPDFLYARLILAVVYSELGRNEEAQAEVAEALRISPRTSLESQRERMPIKDQAVLERFIDGLRKAGLPE